MSVLDYEYVLAAVDGRSIFNLYPTMTAARDDMARANSKEFSMPGWGPYEPMTYNEFKRRERAFWLNDPPIQITGERWNEMLEVLPPMRWIQEPGYNSFLRSEMMSGPYTQQYVRYGTGSDDKCTYWSKMVDITDKSTWLKRGECPAR